MDKSRIKDIKDKFYKREVRDSEMEELFIFVEECKDKLEKIEKEVSVGRSKHVGLIEFLKTTDKLDMPEGKGEGMLFSMANSRMLDIYGRMSNVKRKRFLFFKESNRRKTRIRNKAIKEYYECGEVII